MRPMTDTDDVCVDNRCQECGEFDAECICYDEADEADLRRKCEQEEMD
jgi:hypothetical protein